MKKLIAIFLLFWSPSLFAQFDSLIFEKQCSPAKFGVVALGDQNGDGYDDILLYDCKANKAMIFFGGKPMSTTPVMELKIPDIYLMLNIVAVDINGDGKKDIIFSYTDTNSTIKTAIYYGGILLDTIPDGSIKLPKGIVNGANLIYPLKDFNGGGRQDLLVFCQYPPYSQNYWGMFYIYGTYPQLDTIPKAVLIGDTLNNQRLYSYNVTTGDLDGDGLTDIAITGDAYSGPSNAFISFYKGNSAWNTTPFATYYENQHTFDPTSMKIIQDINGDKKDDILINSYGSFYPYYYGNSILYGSLPIDTIPKIGLNTQNTAIYNIVSPGDVNGDGYNDFLAGAGLPEQARLWVGGKPMTDLPKQYYGGDDNGYGELIANIGDVDGDGIDDICVGQSSYLPYDCIANGFVRIFKGDTLYKQPMGVKQLSYAPEIFALDNPYPNPFNPSTMISYQLAVESYVTLKVYDILGKIVAVLVDQEEVSGKHESKFDASRYQISSGTYLIKLTSTTKEKTTTTTKKMVLTK